MSEFDTLNAKLDDLKIAQGEIKASLEKHTEKLSSGEIRMAGIEFGMREYTAAANRVAEEKRVTNGRVAALELFREQHTNLHLKQDAGHEERARIVGRFISAPALIWSCVGVALGAFTLWDRFS